MKIGEIVVAVDFSECSKAALARASTFAKQYGAHLHLLHAVPPIPYAAPAEFGVPASVTEDIENHAAAKLAEWAGEVEATGRSVSHQVTGLRAVDSICDVARERNAQLITMGTHGYTGLKHILLGSVAERTLRHAPCPVLAVKETPEQASGAIRRILVCTDFSDHAARATDLALSIAQDFQAELHLAHAIHPAIPLYSELPPPEEFLKEVRAAAQRRLAAIHRRVVDAGLDGTQNLLEGDPATAVLELAKLHSLDLVVLGTRGHSGFKHVALGSVAERVTRLVPCSVLVAKADETAD